MPTLLEATCGRYTLRIRDPGGRAPVSDLSPTCYPFRLRWGRQSQGQTGGLLSSSAEVRLEDTATRAIREVFNVGDFTEGHYPVEIEGPWGTATTTRKVGVWHGFVRRESLARPTSYRTQRQEVTLSLYDGLSRLRGIKGDAFKNRGYGGIIANVVEANSNLPVRVDIGADIAPGETTALTNTEVISRVINDSNGLRETDLARQLEELAGRHQLAVWMEPLTEAWHVEAIGQIGFSKMVGTADTQSSRTLDPASITSISQAERIRNIPLRDIDQQDKAYKQHVVKQIRAIDDRQLCRDPTFDKTESSSNATFWKEGGDISFVNTRVQFGGSVSEVSQELIDKGIEDVKVIFTWDSVDDGGNLTVKLQLKERGTISYSTVASVTGFANVRIEHTISKAGRVRILAQGQNAEFGNVSVDYQDGNGNGVNPLYLSGTSLLKKVQSNILDPSDSNDGDTITRYESKTSGIVARSIAEHKARERIHLYGIDKDAVRGLTVKGVHTPLVRARLAQDETRDVDAVDSVISSGRTVDLKRRETTLNDLSLST